MIFFGNLKSFYHPFVVWKNSNYFQCPYYRSGLRGQGLTHDLSDEKLSFGAEKFKKEFLEFLATFYTIKGWLTIIGDKWDCQHLHT